MCSVRSVTYVFNEHAGEAYVGMFLVNSALRRYRDLMRQAERVDWFAAYSRRIDALWDENVANQDLPLEENGIIPICF